MANKNTYSILVLALLGVLLPFAVVVALVFGPSSISLDTSSSGSGITPLRSSRESDPVFWEAFHTARSMPLWTIRSLQKKDGSIEAEVIDGTGASVSKVFILVQKEESGSIVHVRTTGTSAWFDPDAGSRRVQAYLDRLGKRLQLVGEQAKVPNLK